VRRAHTHQTVANGPDLLSVDLRHLRGCLQLLVKVYRRCLIISIDNAVGMGNLQCQGLIDRSNFTMGGPESL
jgi:hypothetical protein